MLAAIPIFCIQDFVQYKISAKLTEIPLKTNSIEIWDMTTAPKTNFIAYKTALGYFSVRL